MLVIDDIHSYYGESYVLHGVSLEVPLGRATVIMGRNGVGKTTVIRSIMGLTPPRRGSITVDDAELAGRPTHEIARRGIGLVPQGRRVFGSLTVTEHLTAVSGGSKDTAWPLERVYEVFPRLQERGQHKARNLSGGEQSMLAIARALRTDPRYLLMDEPTEGLAPTLVSRVYEVVEDLKGSSGLGILLVIPEYEIATRLADYIYVMSTGRVVFEGTPAELEERSDIQSKYIGIGE